MSILEAIDEAELVMVEPEYGLVFVWHGGHGVNIYREDGVAVDYFTMGGSKMPTRAQVAKAIREHIKEMLDEVGE